MRKQAILAVSLVALALIITMLNLFSGQNMESGDSGSALTPPTTETETATFGAGCFWCVEAIFRQVDGVVSVFSGYSGGYSKYPDYKEVSTGMTGHAEVCQVVYNPKMIAYEELLEVFWSSHDPTTLNRQGADVGTQYRSVIFYHNAEQKGSAEKYKKMLEEQNVFEKPIVTEIVRYEKFYEAEPYHQNYYNENPEKQYCTMVIKPKLEKFEQVFHSRFKIKSHN